MKYRAPVIITDELVRQLSVTSDTCERSIIRALAGLPVRGRAGARIRRALEAHGLVERPVTEQRPEAA